MRVDGPVLGRKLRLLAKNEIYWPNRLNQDKPHTHGSAFMSVRLFLGEEKIVFGQLKLYN